MYQLKLIVSGDPLLSCHENGVLLCFCIIHELMYLCSPSICLI